MSESQTGSSAEQPSDETLLQILQSAQTIAVVGLVNDPSRPSYGVAQYLQRQGYRIVPVNPKETEVLGEQAYPDLLAVPFEVDVVDLFRRSEAVGPYVDQAVEKGAKVVWMQLGIENEEAAQRGRAAGLQVVMNHCMKVEHARLVGHKRH